MQFKAEKTPKLALLLDNRIEITFTTDKTNLKAFQSIPDKELLVEIKPYSQKRSLSQNGYMWYLIGELSKKLTITKEAVYKTYIKDYGSFEIIPIKNEAAEKFIKNWSNHGLGWLCEILGKSKITGYTNIIAYYGSSSYNSTEMTHLLEPIIMDCEEQGITTLAMKDIMQLQNDND